MEWEKKKKLVELRNEEFEQFVVENVSEFDEQSWDIFINSVSLTTIDFREQGCMWISIQGEFIKEWERSGFTFDLRTCLRSGLIKALYESELGIKLNVEE